MSVTLDDIMARVIDEVTGTTWDTGQRAEARYGSPPRVVWRPISDEPVGARKSTVTVGGRRSHSVVGLWETFQVHCWGANYAAAVTLRDAVLRAVHHLCAGSWRPVRGDWMPTGEMTLGEESVFRLSLRTTIYDRAATPAHVTSVAIEPATDTPGDGLLDGGLTP